MQISELKGVGPQRALLFGKIGIETVEDLAWYAPLRYVDYASFGLLKDLQPGNCSVSGHLNLADAGYRRKGRHVTRAKLSDGSAEVNVVWFNQPYRKNTISPNVEYVLSGEFKFTGREYAFINPDIQPLEGDALDGGSIVPVYSATKGLSSKVIWNTVKSARGLIAGQTLPLPEDIIFPGLGAVHSKVFEFLHFPEDIEQAKTAQSYFGFFELFALMLAQEQNRSTNSAQKSPVIDFVEAATKGFVGGLDFELTDSQRSAAWQILKDMANPTPMNRLLEGDVGSGKTIVALVASINVIKNQHQVAMMAPTELLASQHFKSISSLLKGLGVSCDILTSSSKAAKRRQVIEDAKSGDIDFLIGTHSLISKDLRFKNLGLVVIDEQHRFGVDQRQTLQTQSSMMPHVLSMTATPIPRTLALTLYGELDVTVMRQKPRSRKSTITELISPNSTQAMYGQISKLVSEGRQGFIVYPLIDRSEDIDAKGVVEGYETTTRLIRDMGIDMIHGRMSQDQQTLVMTRFLNGETKVLFATSLIEVGIDLPNAAFMVIESAERFGLAQLHQLRGRIGRSNLQSHCYVVPTSSSVNTSRLEQFVDCNNGFELAEIDLSIRGPGAVYGTRQHGGIDINLAKLDDSQAISNVRNLARKFAQLGQPMVKYPRLNELVEKYKRVSSLN